MTTAFNSLGEIDSEALRAARIIESVVGNAWATDAAGKFTYVTPATLSLLGMTLEEFNSPLEEGPSGWRRIIHPDDYEGAVATWRLCLQTGEHYNVEHRMLRASGAYGWSRSSGQPLRDSQGHVLAWYGTIIDGDVPPVASERFADVASAALEEKAAPVAPHSLSLIHPNDRTAAAHAAARAFWTGVPQVTRHRQLQADGTYRWTETRSEPRYSVSVDIDDLVTDREPLTTTGLDPLGENEAEPIRSAKVIERIFGNGWAFDAAGRWIYLHTFAQNSLGVTPEDLNASLKEGHTAWKRLLHPDDYDQIAAAWRHCLETGDHFNVEFRFRRATGIYVWARTAARPTRDSQGRITGWFGIALDIDVYKKTVAALRGRERELSQLVDMVPVHIRRLTPGGEPTFFNKRLLDFFGLNDLAQLDKPDMSRMAAAIQTLVHSEDAARLLETVRHSFATGEPYSMKYRMRHADGAYRWFDGRGEPVRDQSGTIVQWYAISIDIDDEMRAQEALRNRERQLQQLIDTVPVQIWCITPGGEPAYINKTMMDYIGLKLEDFDAQQGLAGAIQTIVHPDDRIPLQRALNHSFSTGEAFELKFRNRRSDGSYRWTEGRAEPLRDESGRIIRWFGANVDIHDFVTSQEALQERERFLWELVETLPAMIDCAAPNGEPVYRSQQLREFLGYELEELDGTGKSRLAGTLDAGVHPDDVAGVKENYAHSLATGEPYARRHRLRRFDGEYRWVETRAAAMRNAEGAIVQWNVICLDIENEVRAEEDLRLAQEGLARASQAASLAELSASIAHEVNQPLAAIVANSHACNRWLSAEPPNLERAKITAERIIRDANSAADVVGRIRALFKQSTEPRIGTTISGVVAEARNLMAEEAARRRVRMDINVESNLPPVALDRVQVQQVLVNLIRNGVEAMDSAAGDDRVLGLRVRRMGNVVQTEISDRGRGVEFPDRIFEPFFSTKEHGMGMGLAICRSIVESHGGRLWAEKNQPHGATFVFTLPVEVKASP
ncbi:PAS domain-containing protein [Sinorhizobium numidicum]|uniref:histidine kinase n=1 Tax=Sinorhizobium numidicum TaxID=680248 RepID=A0ABY8CPU8_9HYPH|nr:PAS domain-containing protein [Sinorhizobium numidicum]WEX74692.1 PAS domain-containing protein [Sinorhizobium numidicum]WEX80684.1 PAS domain-containing protein [Sinorhizobium numidicum]